jgi:hypothetical protein
VAGQPEEAAQIPACWPCECTLRHTRRPALPTGPFPSNCPSSCPRSQTPQHRLAQPEQLKGETLRTPVKPALAQLQQQRQAAQTAAADKAAAAADAAARRAHEDGLLSLSGPNSGPNSGPQSGEQSGDQSGAQPGGPQSSTQSGEQSPGPQGPAAGLVPWGSNGSEVVLLPEPGSGAGLGSGAGGAGGCGGARDSAQTWIGASPGAGESDRARAVIGGCSTMRGWFVAHPPRPSSPRTPAVLEYCDKGCLQDAIDCGWMRENPAAPGPPNILAVLATAREIASGMAYLHARGVVHGDLRWAALGAGLAQEHPGAPRLARSTRPLASRPPPTPPPPSPTPTRPP